MPAFPASSGAGVASASGGAGVAGGATAASAFSPPVQKKIDTPPPKDSPLPPSAPTSLPRADESSPSAGVAGASAAPAPKGGAGAQSGGVSSAPSPITGNGMLAGAKSAPAPKGGAGAQSGRVSRTPSPIIGNGMLGGAGGARASGRTRAAPDARTFYYIEGIGDVDIIRPPSDKRSYYIEGIGEVDIDQLPSDPRYGWQIIRISTLSVILIEIGDPAPSASNTLAAARQQHYASQADGGIANFSTGGDGVPNFIVIPSHTITFGTRLLGDQSKAVFSGAGGKLIIATNGISVSAGMLYSTPGDLYLDAVGGGTVSAADAKVTFSYDHRIHSTANGGASAQGRINILHRIRPASGASDESGTPGDAFVHYLGGEYAAFAHYPQERTFSPTVIQGGSRAQAAYMNTLAASVNYTIPAGGAFGYMRDVMGGGYHLIRNTVIGRIAVDFAKESAMISVSLSGMESRPADAYSYVLDNFVVPLYSGKRAFGNQDCPSSGGSVSSGCGGRVALSEQKFSESEGGEGGFPGEGGFAFIRDTYAIQNTAAASGAGNLDVFGGFYGNLAQEVAVAVYHTYAAKAGANLSHPRTVAIGILGRKENSSAPPPPTTFQITIRSGMITTAPQRAGVRGAVHTAVVQVSNEGGSSIVISRQSTGYLNIDGVTIGTFTSALNYGQLTLRGTGSIDSLQTITVHHGWDGSNSFVITLAGSIKAFKLRGNSGVVYISLHLYDNFLGKWAFTPWFRQAVNHRSSGALVTAKWRINSLMPDIAGTDDTALLMESRYAAFGLNFGYAASGTPRLTNFFRYGSETPASALQRMFAAAKVIDRHYYFIPRKAVNGYYENQVSPKASRLLNNEERGILAVDFRRTLARLSLRIHAFANHMSSTDDWWFQADEFVSFSDFALGSWDSGSGIGNSGCGLAGGDETDATACAGGFSLAGVITLTSQARAAGSDLDVNVRFYGAHAEEIAGFARYISDEHIVRLGFLGVNTRGGVFVPPAPVSSYAALSWDSADGGGASMTVHVDASGAPVSLSVGGRGVAFGTEKFGHVHRYFRNTLGVVLRPRSAGAVIGDYATLSVHSVTIASRAQSSVYAVEGQAYQSANGAVFSYLVKGRDAAFFYILDDQDIRKARHGFYGAPAALWMMDSMYRAGFHGAYTIPAGGAQGFAWNSSKASDYFLRNSAAGKIGVDFGAGVLTLGITVGAVDKDGVYTDDFLRVTDFRMKIRGNVFNNYHCTGASHAAGTACTGVLQFAADGALAGQTSAVASPYLAKYDASVTAASELGDVQVHAGGGFYGEGIPSAVAGGIAYYVGDSSEKGMRLQFLGANPWHGKVYSDLFTVDFGLLPVGRQHYAAQADGAVATLTTNSNGIPVHIALSNRTITFGTYLLGDLSEKVFPGAGGKLIIGANGISVSAGMLYSTPGDLYLDDYGGNTVAAASAAVTVSYHHDVDSTSFSVLARKMNVLHRVRTASDGSGTPGDMFVQHLRAEYAIFAHYPQERTFSPTVIQGGARAPAAYMNTLAASVNYTIPAGGAFGYMSDVRGGGYHLVRNIAIGRIAVDFAKESAAISVSLSGMESDPADAYSYVLDNFVVPLSSGKRAFGNQDCPSSGGSASSGCGGEVALSEQKLVESEGGGGAFVRDTYTTQNTTAASGAGNLDVFGGFYGNLAQEVAVAVYHTYAAKAGANLSHPRTVAIGILGRKENSSASGAGDSSAPAGLSPYIQAEHVAFAASGSGSDLRMVHYGTRAKAAVVSTMAAAVYRIAAGKAGGIYSSAGVAAHTLSNSAAGQLQVDFQNSRATLDLAFQASTGAHGYEIDDLSLQVKGNGFRFCADCTGSIRGSGDLSDFAGTGNLHVDGAFYGAAAQEAAGVLRHTSGGGKALDLGFIGEKE